SRVPGADVTKLRTIEAGTADLEPGDVPAADLCLIDAEHTNPAVMRDAWFCARALNRPAVIVFHDLPIVGRGIGRFLQRVGGFGYPLPDLLFVIELGGPAVFPKVADLVPYAGWWAAFNRL